MSNGVMELAQALRSMRPMVPAKTFDISKRFYIDLGFEPRPLTDNLVEMRLGAYAFILQGYYVQQWADNFVMHMSVSDLRLWWNHIVSIDLPSRYGVKSPSAPQSEGWGPSHERDRSVGCALENCGRGVLEAWRRHTPFLMCSCRG